jgi:prolyl-tRNA editing enzyme YbaK/EbsC (Cys-tRNA(Pro) deacylase)
MSEQNSILHPQVLRALEQLHLEFTALQCDPSFADTAQFCQYYNFAPEQAANAIIGASKTDPVQYACCLVLANCRLDVNKKLCQLLGVKRASFASAEQTLQLTGMLIGGVTPVGLPDMPIYVDAAVMGRADGVIIGGGNRSSKLLVKPAELLKIPGVEVIEGLAIAK